MAASARGGRAAGADAENVSAQHKRRPRPRKKSTLRHSWLGHTNPSSLPVGAARGGSQSFLQLTGTFPVHRFPDNRLLRFKAGCQNFLSPYC
jgi:hypothetical protein